MVAATHIFWDKTSINALLMSNDRAVERALIVLYARQTHDEKSTGETIHHNGRGFSGLDAAFLTSLAQRVEKGWGLTPKQMACLRKTNKAGFCLLAKYHAQLVEEIKLKEQAKREWDAISQTTC